jgi:hypothetical protein
MGARTHGINVKKGGIVMDIWISYLTDHPIIGAALVAVLILFIVMVAVR